MIDKEQLESWLSWVQFCYEDEKKSIECGFPPFGPLQKRTFEILEAVLKEIILKFDFR